jgi:hypothetical protein
MDPLGVAVSPDGAGVYVADSGSNTVSQHDLGADGGLQPKSTPAVATGGGSVHIAFSPLPCVSTSKEQCKDGGWRNFPQFKNQGDCVSFVETGK